MKKFCFGVVLIFLFVLQTESQVVYEPGTNNPVYDLLDELATLKIITINSVVKPYSRVYIAEKLDEAAKELGIRNEELGIKGETDKKRVSKRIIDEIKFYLRDYGFELGIRNEESGIRNKESGVQSSKLKVQDSTLSNNSKFLIPNSSFKYDPLSFNLSTKAFKLSLRPALGARFIVNENGNVWDLTGGGEVFGYVGKHVGYYFNIEQTWQSEAMVKPEYFTLEEGKVWSNAGNGSVTNTEWRGGISVAWKWGDFGIYKDRPVWGNGVHGTNILSGHAPSFPYIQLHIKPAKWIEFRYIHGWLNTDKPGINPFTTDSVYATYCENHSKYIAANMLTITPWRGLDLSVGNSIIYSDVNPSPYMLIPFLFYNPSDNQRTGYKDQASSNSQFFLSISTRQIRHLNLYLTLYVDELRVSRILTKDQYNFTSWKAGFTLSEFPLKNVFLSFEWTYTKPITYKHYVVATNFNNDSYNMGDWMRDNSQEFYVALGYRPLRGLQVTASFNYCEHGNEYEYARQKGMNVTRLPVLTNLTWINSSVSLEILYQIVSNTSVFLNYLNTNHKGDIGFSPLVMHGRTNSLVAGINVGF